ncbi:Y4yA family PLP-dependent enzyme [Pseudoduganella armeniaca]|uniref:Decarboxylase n=1 Tax=Pseudoduganella armeniaca TaxID=2072590 RepID=A0A2R4CCD7_9BURK|nr:Y4yA family PLP-dependent enzyme [Pseudoduganella armeniaca]AVR97150.1 decarboxylase [Pseudoduganella armeniaca]
MQKPLVPLLDQAVAALLHAAPGQLAGLVGRHGSPLNVVWPHILRQNVDTLRAVLRAHDVRHEIFYGAKVNKSPALVHAAVRADAGVDVSSVYELRDALGAGADPARVVATGPAKTAVFHAELLACGALISVDSCEELAALEAAVVAPARARVLLRYRPESNRNSRFGMDAAELLQCLHRLAARRASFIFEGFHCHLGGYAWQTRVQAIGELAASVAAARELDLPPRMLDIGGGLPVRYVDGDAYDAFLPAQEPADYRTGRVPTSYYPYGGRTDAASWLHNVLAAPCGDGRTVAQYLNAERLTLALEPGRSLVDQAAVTAFRVTQVKALADGKHVVFVEGSSFSACETWFGSEFLVDPLLLPSDPQRASEGAPFAAYIAGHSCLDDDVITNRILNFDRRPMPGDLLVYANTAGYQMDLLENEFHRHPMPRRIVVHVNARGAMEFSPD